MSKKNDYVNKMIYSPHMRGGKHENNPVKNELILTERMYARVITELACNRFKWEGLPDTIDPRFLELTLFRHALSVFFRDDDKNYGTKYHALQGAGAGVIDPYDNPLHFQVYGNSMLNRRLSRDECVPIYANYLRSPDHDIVLLYASRLAQIDRTISIAGMNMRNTNFVMATENQQLSMTNLIRQRDAGEMTVHIVKGQLAPDQIFALDMKQHPDTLPKLQTARDRMWSNCMTLMGINNANQDKKERLVSAEVGANDEQVETMRRIALNSRQQACAEINKKYGLKVSVDYHVVEAVDPMEQEGAENGDIHNAVASSDGTD